MPENADAILLLRFVATRDEGAFAELVRRHLDGVYSAALRRVGGDAQLAEDVAQQVFVALARKAATVARHGAVTGWLYTATRHEAANVVRGERRRKTRETEAHLIHEMLGATGNLGEADWSRVAPVLTRRSTSWAKMIARRFWLVSSNGGRLPKWVGRCGSARTRRGCGWSGRWRNCAVCWRGVG